MGDEKEKDEKGGITIKLPSKTAMAIVVALAGTAWNKVETYLNEERTESVQEGTFKLTAARLEEIYEELEYLAEESEQCQRDIQELYELGGNLAKYHRKVEAPKPDPEPAEDASMDEFGEEAVEASPVMATEGDRADTAFKKARLPDFDQLQQQIQEKGGLDEILQHKALPRQRRKR